MADTFTSGQWTGIGTVGTATLTDRSDAVLIRVLTQGTYVGTVNVYDCATIAGTSATNLIYSLGLPTTSVPQSIEVGANARYGLTYASTGTPSVVLIWK